MSFREIDLRMERQFNCHLDFVIYTFVNLLVWTLCPSIYNQIICSRGLNGCCHTGMPHRNHETSHSNRYQSHCKDMGPTCTCRFAGERAQLLASILLFPFTVVVIGNKRKTKILINTT